MTRIVYIKSADWNQLFGTIKLQAFTQGYTELCDYLTQCKLETNVSGDICGNIDSKYWFNQRLNWHRNNETNKIKDWASKSKVIVKQARNLGIKVSKCVGDVGHMNLRGLA